MSLAPQAYISEADCEAGLHRLQFEAAYSSATTALTSGVILTAFALHLGASNLVVGILASAPFLTQLLQAPAVLLVERLRARKRIAVLTSIVGRAMLVPMGIAAFLPSGPGLLLLALGQFILCGMSAFGGCAWNSWIRDLAPERRLGRLFARRTAWSAAVSLVAGLTAALLLDQTGAGSSGQALAFAALYGVGCLSGMVSASVVSRIPEPLMTGRHDDPRLAALFRAPLADRNFRRLMVFVGSWQFAVNLATPFFTVFIVRQLGYSMTFVMLLSVVSQLANLAALRNWGMLGDRFANKSVLLVAAPTYILSIMAMIGASQIGHPTALTVYLIVLHVAMGTSVAGVTLAATNIALKLSPRGSATAYVATNALTTATAAGCAPIIGGAFADFFSERRLELLLRWTSPEGVLMFAPRRLSHWDFYFLFAGILGFFALHRLGLVREQGEIRRSEMIQQLLHQTRRSVRNLSTVAGLRALTELPATMVRDAHVRMRRQRRRLRHRLRPAAG